MRNKISNSLWGLFLIAIGIGIAGDVLNIWDFQLFFDGWWTFLIIIPCFISMIQSGFGFGSTCGFIIGVVWFLSYHINFNFSIWRLIIPGILILIGLRIMFQDIPWGLPILISPLIGWEYNTAEFTGAGCRIQRNL